jgi:hypothetical protein
MPLLETLLSLLFFHLYKLAAVVEALEMWAAAAMYPATYSYLSVTV